MAPLEDAVGVANSTGAIVNCRIWSVMLLLVLSLQWLHTLFVATPLAENASALALLDDTEALACRYFTEQVLSNGLVKDTSREGDRASIAATGFGLAALTVMAERFGTSERWNLSPERARAQAQLIAQTLDAIQEHQEGHPETYGIAGFFYHFVDEEGKRVGRCEVSTVDTAILTAGLMTAASYFGGEIADRSARILDRLDWEFFLRCASFLTVGVPSVGFLIPYGIVPPMKCC